MGRDGLKKSDVHKIAMGRVWSGKEALDLELVDEMGSLQTAIDFAANKVGIENNKVKLIHLPERKNDELLELLSSLEIGNKSSSEAIDYINNINSVFEKSVKSSNAVDKYQTIFPFEIRIF
jgi:protease-4